MDEYRYESLDLFLDQNSWRNGTHKVFVEPGVWLDVLVANSPERLPTSSRIPVFFSGALTTRVRGGQGTLVHHFSRGRLYHGNLDMES